MSTAIAEYLTEQTRLKKWSGRTLAMYADLSHGAVARALRGEVIPSPESIEKMARALGVDEYHMLRLAGHVEGPRQSIVDPRVSLLAQRVDALGSEARALALAALNAVLDVYAGSAAVPHAPRTVAEGEATYDYDALMEERLFAIFK